MGLGEVPAYLEIRMLITCRVCRKELDAEEHFYPRKGTKTGYQYECKKCRREINEKYKKRKQEREREKREEAAKAKEVPKRPRVRKKKSTWNHREAHRKKLLKSSGAKIAEGELIAETPRSMTFNLSLIVEQQLRLFYGRQIKSAANLPRMNQVLEDALFEVKQALSRAGVRMKPVINSEDMKVDLDGPLEALQKKSAARALLGVSEDATQDEIKKAYRSKARDAHPDHAGSTEAMQRVNEAFSLLVEDQTNGR
jgi:DnaJ-domain-containing protein 1